MRFQMPALVAVVICVLTTFSASGALACGFSGGCKCYGPYCNSTRPRPSPRNWNIQPRPRPRPNPKLVRANRLGALGRRYFRRGAVSRSPRDYDLAARYYHRANRLWPHRYFDKGRHWARAHYFYVLANAAWKRGRCTTAAKHYRQVIAWSKYDDASNRRADRRNLQNAQRCVAAQRWRQRQRAAMKRWANARKAFIAQLLEFYKRFDRLTGGYMERWKPKPNTSALPAAFQTPKAPKPKDGALQRIGAAGGVKGEVEVCNKRGCRPVTSGGDLFFGDLVKTGPGGRAQFMFLDETVATVGPNSEVYIDEFVYDPFTQTGQVAARMTKGVFRFVTGKVAKNKASKSKVKVLFANLLIRGTDFVLRVNPEKRVIKIALYSGKLVYTPAGSKQEMPLDPGLWTISWSGTTPKRIKMSREIETSDTGPNALVRQKQVDDRGLPITLPPGFKKPQPPKGAWDVIPKWVKKPARRQKLATKLATARAALNRGVAAAKRKQWDTAVKELSKAVKLTSGSFSWPHGMAPEPLLNLALAHDAQGRQPLTAVYLYRAYLAAAPQSPLAGKICARIPVLVKAHENHRQALLAQATSTIGLASQVCTRRYCPQYVAYVQGVADYVAALAYDGQIWKAQRLARAMAFDPRMSAATTKFFRRMFTNFARPRIYYAVAVALAQTNHPKQALQIFRGLRRIRKGNYPRTVAETRKRFETPPSWWIHTKTGRGAIYGRSAAKLEAIFWLRNAAGGRRPSVSCRPDRNSCPHGIGNVRLALLKLAANRRAKSNRNELGHAAFRSARVFSHAALTAGVTIYRYRIIDRTWRDFWKRQGEPRPGRCK